MSPDLAWLAHLAKHAEGTVLLLAPGHSCDQWAPGSTFEIRPGLRGLVTRFRPPRCWPHPADIVVEVSRFDLATWCHKRLTPSLPLRLSP